MIERRRSARVKLVDHSQVMTVAARATAEKKSLGQ
jgi:hypothetical protein